MFGDFAEKLYVTTSCTGYRNNHKQYCFFVVLYFFCINECLTARGKMFFRVLMPSYLHPE